MFSILRKALIKLKKYYDSAHFCLPLLFLNGEISHFVCGFLFLSFPLFAQDLEIVEGWSQHSPTSWIQMSVGDYFSDERFEDVISPIESVWAWNTEQRKWEVYFWNESVDEFNNTHSTHFDELQTIEAWRGYWIKSSDTVMFTPPD